MDCILETRQYNDLYFRTSMRNKNAHALIYTVEKDIPGSIRPAYIRTFYSSELNRKARAGDQDAIAQLQDAGRMIGAIKAF